MLSLDALCDELKLAVLSYLDIPDLLALSRTSHCFRRLTRDPLLHSQRRLLASARLSSSLQSRPPLSSLLPPSGTIYLSRTHLLARTLHRKLISIRLAKNLSRRPSASSLVQYNIIPSDCCHCDRATGEVIVGGRVAPAIVETKRRVEREQIKDGLRGWLQQHGVKARRERERVLCESDKSRLSVGALVRKFTSAASSSSSSNSNSRTRSGGRWGRPAGSSGSSSSSSSRTGGGGGVGSTGGTGSDTGRGVGVAGWPDEDGDKLRTEEPTRARVLGLRKFWEGLAGARLGVVGT